jgi:hypothetical protein
VRSLKKVKVLKFIIKYINQNGYHLLQGKQV